MARSMAELMEDSSRPSSEQKDSEDSDLQVRVRVRAPGSESERETEAGGHGRSHLLISAMLLTIRSRWCSW